MWDSELEQGAADLLDRTPNHYTFDLYLRIKQALSGFDGSELEFANNVSESLRFDYCKRLQPGSSIRLLALNLEYHNFNHEILLDTKYRGLIKALPANLDRYPYILQTLYKNKFSLCSTTKRRHSLAKRYSELASDAHRLLSCTYPIENMLAHKETHSIALVGNGPASLGQGLGARIDSADIVIRFNYANMGGEYKNDYGSRTNLWVVSPSTNINPDKMLSNRICISGVSIFDKPSQYWKSLSKVPNTRFYTFSKKVWYQLVAELKAPPSAGLLTLATLCQNSSISRNLKLYGMSIGTPNCSKNHYGDNSVRSERHNWPLEAETVAAMYKG